MKSLSLRIVVTVLAFAAAASDVGAVTYTDSTFNLANYQIQTLVAGGPTVVVSQTQTGGNPAQALVVDTNVAAGGSFNSNNYIRNTAFSYDPFASGAIASISLSQDIWISLSGIALGTPSANFIIQQGGNTYAAFVNVASLQSTWQTANLTTLTPATFNRVTNLTTLSLDTSFHPNFSSGVMQFGMLPGLNFSGAHAAAQEQVIIDNFAINISPVPELPSGLLLLLGAGYLLGRKKYSALPTEA